MASGPPVTASHKALERAHCQKRRLSQSELQGRLLELHSEFGSWRAVADRLAAGRLDRAMLCRVANGKQKPPRSVTVAVARYDNAWLRPAVDWLKGRQRQ